MKRVHVSGVTLQREQLRQVAEQYQTAARDSGLAVAMLNAGYPQAGRHADRLVAQLLAAGAGTDRPLTLASSASPVDVQQLHALQALDTVAVAAVVARQLELGDAQTRVLCLAALLHLVGLQRLPEALRHEALLSTKSDIQAFRDYPSLGAQLIRSCADLPREVADIVAQHRERLDGSGFPDRLCGTETHPFALYVGVIHQFVSLTTRGKPATHTAALANLYRTQRAGFGDEVIAAFVAALTVYPPGTFLSLTDGSIGRVVRVSERERMRPTIIVYDSTLLPAEAEILDLAATRHVGVQTVLDPRQLMSGIIDFFGGNAWGGLALSIPQAAALVPA